MPYRDLFVLTVVVISIPLALRTPFAGLLTFTWLAYMRAQDLCWGFARNMRFSLFVAVAMIAGWVLNDSRKRPFMRLDIRSVLMLSLLVSTTISLVMAKEQGDFVMRRYFEFLKIIIVALFTTGQVDSRKRLRLLMWTIALSLGFYGVKGGIHGILSGGSVILRGPGGMLEDNNDFALALCMNMPILLYLGQLESKRWVKRACIAGTVLSLITILLTHSRGGFLAAVAVLGVFFFRSRMLVRAIAIALLCLLCFYAFVPEHVLDRLLSIGKFQSDSSAQGRLHAWGIALRMINAFPLFGVGIRNFQVHFGDFAGGTAPEGFSRVAHNSYLQIWAEGGTIAFLLYIGLLFSCFYTLRRLRLASKRDPAADWIYTYCRMFEASLAGFIVGATFLNRGHFDLVYHLIGLVTAFQLIAFQWLAQPMEVREGLVIAEDELLPLEPSRVKRKGLVPDLPRWEK